jgi:phage terminase large subunit GpA-like protein
VTFCAEYAGGVIPIIGAERATKNQRITEFTEFTTSGGTVGYRIIVDHYKDRMSTVLRREWNEGSKEQDIHHFNAPVDILDNELKELTIEDRRKETDPRGNVSYKWHRPGNARNELWDLLGYGYAAVEIMAYQICVQHYELDKVDMPSFWTWLEEHPFYLQG